MLYRYYRYNLLHDFGLIHLEMGDFSLAETHFTQVVNLPRSDPSLGLVTAYARIAMVLTLLMQDRLEEARQTALSALAPALACTILLSHAEVFSLALAKLKAYRSAAYVAQASDWFRSVTRSVRTAGEVKVREAIRESLALGPPEEEPPPPGPYIESKLAEYIGTALSRKG
jgi:hypothetical protein